MGVAWLPTQDCLQNSTTQRRESCREGNINTTCGGARLAKSHLPRSTYCTFGKQYPAADGLFSDLTAHNALRNLAMGKEARVVRAHLASPLFLGALLDRGASRSMSCEAGPEIYAPLDQDWRAGNTFQALFLPGRPANDGSAAWDYCYRVQRRLGSLTARSCRDRSTIL
jgi:hypothetical protein